MLRSSLIGIGLAVAALAAFQVTGCGDSGGGGGAGSSGSTAGTTGSGTAGTSGGAGTTGGGGTTGAGGTPGTAGNNSSTAGATGTAGSGSGSAGTAGSGSGSAGTGGSGSGSAGTVGTGGATGAGGTGGTAPNPNCPTSISDKSTTCTMEGLACPKTCGIENKGTKTCTCTAGVFVCESVAPSCHYAAGTALDCYRLPTPVPACPTGTQHNGTCSSAACMPCSGYADSGGAAKTGYCVCVGTQYKCASDKEWPTF